MKAFPLHLIPPKTCTDIKRPIGRTEQNARGYIKRLTTFKKSHRGRITDTIRSVTVITSNQPTAAHTQAPSNRLIMKRDEGLLIPSTDAALATISQYQIP